jgi:transcriptional regulator with XRE-family HTH domain
MEVSMTEKEFYSTLSQKLRELVDKTGLKQKDIAAKMQVNNSFVGNILNEREKASVYRLNQMLASIDKPTLLEWLDSLIDEKKTLKLTLKSPASPPTPWPASLATNP